MLLFPIADIMLIERRTCQRCQRTYMAPGIFIHRLDTTPRGVPHASSIHVRHLSSESDIDRKQIDPPIELRATHIFDVSIPACFACWEPNISWQNANSIIPELPERQAKLEEAFVARAEHLLAKGKLRPLVDTIDDMDL